MCFYVVKIDRHVGLVVYNRNKLNVFFFANNVLISFVCFGWTVQSCSQKVDIHRNSIVGPHCFSNLGTYSMG